MANAAYGSVLLPAGAAAARLIVCERAGRWAAALRRELAARPFGGTLLTPRRCEVRVYETRNLTDCWGMLAEAPASFVMVELSSGGVAALLRQMARLEREFPLARLAVVAEGALAGYEWLMREAGAVHFTCSRRHSGPLARLARRHLAQAPVPQRSLARQIWDGLPWGRPS